LVAVKEWLLNCFRLLAERHRLWTLLLLLLLLLLA
jgi:hypothetical protein